MPAPVAGACRRRARGTCSPGRSRGSWTRGSRGCASHDLIRAPISPDLSRAPRASLRGLSRRALRATRRTARRPRRPRLPARVAGRHGDDETLESHRTRTHRDVIPVPRRHRGRLRRPVAVCSGKGRFVSIVFLRAAGGAGLRDKPRSDARRARAKTPSPATARPGAAIESCRRVSRRGAGTPIRAQCVRVSCCTRRTD
jgi:hypothetical protein